MRSSTTIAEGLGEEKYFNLLKNIFQDITSAIQDCKGEIYQYVGDEVVINWKAGSDAYNSNCVRCFFAVQRALSKKAPEYLKNYNLVPEFKAGLHFGPVMVGEVGVIKRDIAFSGDVLNTASRIQNMCNEKGVNLLCSKSLFDKLDLSMDGFISTKIGNLPLRGKLEPVPLYTIALP
jgi:adenylate cyclase